MAQPRTIKKYSNRRMYDTESSRYVNLEEVAALVRGGQEIQVLDAKTGEDLTRHVLTQIIVEESREPGGGPPLDFLRDLVRSTDRAQKDFLHWYLGTAAEAYEKMQQAWRGPVPWPSLKAQRVAWAKMWDPFGAVRRMVERVQEVAAPSEPEPEETGGDARAALAELRQRVEELEARLTRE